jgi:ATP-binding cassette subfamily B protein
MSAKIHPIQRFTQLLHVERADLCLVGVYTLVMILLGLSVPIATQSLVNTIAAGLFAQPVYVLSLIVLAGLGLAGVLHILTYTVVERLQLRVFTNTAMALARRMVAARCDRLRTEYAPELVNRFFDVITIQKALSKLLLDGFTALLQAIVSLIFLAFYSPQIMTSAIILFLVFLGTVILLGFGGVKSSVAESYEKYHVADWLEDVARCHNAFKLYGKPQLIDRKTDQVVLAYLEKRNQHFQVNRRQLIGYYIFAALASSGVLFAGGLQVLSGNLTIGQLVASQILVTLSLSSFEKLVRQSDKYFDLLAGLDKVGHVVNLPIERQGGRTIPERPGAMAASVECRNVHFSYSSESPVLVGLNLTLHPGERISLVGSSGAGKSTLASLLCGLDEPNRGDIHIEGIDIREVDLKSLRRIVGIAGLEREIFDGTILENILVGRDHLTADDVRWALDVAQLADDVAAMPDGIKTGLISGGQNLSRGQAQRLMIARAIVDRPHLLILDEAFTGIDERISQKILDRIFCDDYTGTIIDISHQPEVILRTETVYVMADGAIREHGSPQQLAADPDSEFSKLFPFLSANLRSGMPYQGGQS